MWGREGEHGAAGQERSGLAGQGWGLDRSVLVELWGARGVCSLLCSPWQLSSLALVAFGKCVGGGQE